MLPKHWKNNCQFLASASESLVLLSILANVFCTEELVKCQKAAPKPTFGFCPEKTPNYAFVSNDNIVVLQTHFQTKTILYSGMN